MHIIWMTTQFPSSATDTKGSFIYRTIRELAKHYKITVLCLYTVVPPIIPMIRDLANAAKILKGWRERFPKHPVAPMDVNAKVIYVKYFRLPRGIFQHLEGWFGYLAMIKYRKDILKDDTLIHATWLFPEGDLANIISNKFNIPFLVTLMGSDVHFLIEGSRKWYKVKEIIQNATWVTSVSQQLYNDLENKSIFIPKGKKQLTHTIYDFNKFKILDKEKIRISLNIKTSDKIIFYAGALRDIKNVDLLITAFSSLLSVDEELSNNIKLIIAGKGEEEGKLKSLVAKLKIKDKVNFVGGLNGEEIVKYYNASDLFCLQSKNEGLPNVIIESLLCGLPVVASAVGEIPFIIENGKNGYLVKANSVQSLVQGIKNALDMKWDRYLLRDSVSFLSVNNVLAEYNRVYSEVVRK